MFVPIEDASGTRPVPIIYRSELVLRANYEHWCWRCVFRILRILLLLAVLWGLVRWWGQWCFVLHLGCLWWGGWWHLRRLLYPWHCL